MASSKFGCVAWNRRMQFARVILLAQIWVLVMVTEATWRMTGKRMPTRLDFRAVSTPSYSYETRWYTQSLDHFSTRNTTFQERFLFAPQFWHGAKQKAPIFMYCGNEGDIEWFAENSGFMWDIAPKFGALLVFPEHRYYGESMPYGSAAAAYKNAESLSYLTSEQALADYVTFITDLKKNLSADASPVVVFGGSYGGMLAAWFRLKYPHIAIGAIASSAPILYFDNITPSDSFTDIVSRDFRIASESCFSTIKKSWDVIAERGRTAEGLQKLSKLFHMCSDLTDHGQLSDWLEAAYSYLAMTDYPYAANFIMPLPGYPILEVCKAMDAQRPDSDILSRVFAGVSVFYNYTGDVKCFDIDDDPHGMSGWGWQACTEMVMPFSSNATTGMFTPYGWNLSAYEESCRVLYGVTTKPHWIVEEFGGQDIGFVLKHFGSNIVFANGLLDPWSGGSVLKSVSPSLVALTTELGAHHLDLRGATPSDPRWLTNQRAEEVKNIARWLREYYRERSYTAQARFLFL